APIAMCRQATGWAVCALLISSFIVNTLSYPNQQFKAEGGFYPVQATPAPAPAQVAQAVSQREERKFAEKPNAIKKVALDDLDDIQSNQISESSGGGFTWSNLLGMIMQLIFNPGAHQGPNKSDGLDDGPIASSSSPWGNLISVGLKILTAILGGGAANNEGIDKVDNGGSPMQGVLAAVLGALVGGTNTGQVNLLAKQAGEVRMFITGHYTFNHNSYIYTHT
ncbi:hypothetical protein NQ317_019118, partial [Molorchus minor]